ncbi:hypothetical protein NG791_06280 [Laspinema sp. D1]|uniref:hypothetical protein n=1 Tax=Laspinema palackyanum TaxID=3231601 RepID=UPI003499FD9F|nr:hypothetical protein [Laspinema sp. D2b]
MNKVILSSLALLGLSVAFVAPAQAQDNVNPRVLVNSTSPGASITGAAAVRNFNTMTSTAAVQVTYPNGVYAESAIVSPVYNPAAGGTITKDTIVVLQSVEVKPVTLKLDAPQGASVEGAVATLITGGQATTLGDRVSLIQAWRSGLN